MRKREYDYLKKVGFETATGKGTIDVIGMLWLNDPIFGPVTFLEKSRLNPEFNCFVWNGYYFFCSGRGVPETYDALRAAIPDAVAEKPPQEEEVLRAHRVAETLDWPEIYYDEGWRRRDVDEYGFTSIEELMRAEEFLEAVSKYE